MQPSSDQPTGADRSRQLRRYGPLALIAVIAVVAILAAVLAGGDDDEDTAGGGSGSTPSGGQVEAPDGAISWTMAQEDDVDVTFADTCDEESGKVAIPYFLAQPCYAEVEDNGGATSKGVTEDAIKVVVYVAPESDAALDYITSAIANDDSPQQVKDTYQGYADLFNATYQTYGRKIELQFLDGSGVSQDEVAARADAVKAAQEMDAFAVWGGPVLTSAFADELAAQGVVCIGCTGGDPEFYEDRAPYLFNAAINADQVQQHLVEYVTKKLAGKPAEFAGDEALTTEDRRFGYLWIESNDSSASQAEKFEERLGEEDIELAESLSYTLDPARLQEQATSVIAKLKAAGVTSVVFSGDPVAPANFTQEATAQDFHPEWILGPQTLVDVTAFARTYDQEQWAHAFGPSPLTARFPSEDGAAYSLYEWFNGEPPPAIDTNAVMFPNPALFFAGIQAAGPNLTPESFRDGLFSRAPTPNAITQPSLSFGDHDLWEGPDWNGVDDMTEIWWDPDATGPDEIRKEGTGMYRYVDGGARYFPGDWTEDLTVFDEAGSVTILDGPPEAEAVPEYPSP